MAVEFGEPGERVMVDRILIGGMLPQHRADFLHGGGDIRGQFKDCLITRWGALLREKPDRHVLFQGNGSRVGGGLLQDQGEERRFAGPIGSDQADAVTSVDLKRGLLKKGPSAVGFGKTGSCQHGKRSGAKRCP